MLYSFLFTLLTGAFVMANNPIDIIKNCPESPNCVSTMTDQQSKLMNVIPYGDNSSPKDLILKVLQSQPRVKIIENTDNFIHTVFTTALFRFKDDVYFYIDTDKKHIHFKSQSRKGYSDMGANRKRMQSLSKEIKGQLTK